MSEDLTDSVKLFMEIAPSLVLDRYKAVPENIKEMSATRLDNRFSAEDRLLIRRLRTTFWIEADRAIATGSPFLLKAVYEGFCDRSYFLKNILGNSFALVYLLIRPPGDQALLEEMLIRGLEIQREILELPHLDDRGKIDTKILGIKNTIIENTHNRLKGTPVSRTQVHQHHTSDSPRITTNRFKGLPEADIKARILELESGEKNE